MTALLADDELPPYETFNPEGAAPILLICDHASRRIPRALGDLGLASSSTD
jgi:predicted N-formylglutamate amidohydrolase